MPPPLHRSDSPPKGERRSRGNVPGNAVNTMEDTRDWSADEKIRRLNASKYVIATALSQEKQDSVSPRTYERSNSD